MQTSDLVKAHRPPCPEDVRAQLERIVTSREFPTAGRGAAFLTYIVEEVLAGRTDRIKGYAIALEVFRRDQHFTQEDPVVRIEAGRLRRALERYYLVAGQNDPVRIDVPKGGYIPVFSWMNTPSFDAMPSTNEEIATDGAKEPTRPAGRLWLAAVAAAVVAVTGLGGWVWTNLAGNEAFPDEPTLVVAPFANLGTGAEAQMYAAGLMEELLTTLPRFKEIKVFGRETTRNLTPDVDVVQVREQLGARYLLAGGIRVSGDRMRVSARLVDTGGGAILWSQNYDSDLRTQDLFTIQADVASRVAMAVAQPYGVMAQADASRPPPDDAGAYGCALSFYSYRAELSPESHASVRTCLEAAVARYPSYATAWAMLSMIYLDEDRYRFNRSSADPSPVERALVAARRAIQIEPGNVRGLQALMVALFFNQETAEAIRVGEQALANNPNDTELMGEFGTRLAIMGHWERGAALLDKAAAFNPDGGGFYRGTRALAAYMLGDTANAVSLIRQADLQKFPLFHAVAAIIYAEAGMMDDAGAEGGIFVAMRPDFVPNFFAEMRSRNMQPKDLKRLLAGLRKAGVTVPSDVMALTASADR